MLASSKIGQSITWILNVDYSTYAHASKVGMIFKTLDNMIIEQSLQFGFQTTNNEAEYKALIAGLNFARSLEASKIEVLNDS